MGAPQLFAAGPTTGGTPVGGSGTPDTIPRWATGTTLGDSPLTVSGSNVTGAGAIRATGTTAGAPAFTGSDTDTGMYFPANNQVRFSTGGSLAIAIDASQNVGIGTAAPNKRFQVVDGLSAEIRTTTTGNSAGNTITHRFSSSALAGAYEGGGAYLQAIQGSGIDLWNLAFGTANASATATEWMRITNAGNVGIGTASPGTVLHVFGASGLRVQDSTSAAGFDIVTAAGNTYLTNKNNATLFFGTNSIARVSVNASSMDASIVSGYGLKLPATPGNADTQTLDCYQENPLATTAGNGWTPTLSAAATWGGTQPTVDYARYIRIGSMVFCEVRLSGVALTATYGTTTISQPPVTINATAIESAVPVSTAAGSGVGVCTSTTVFLPTLGATTAMRLSWFYFTTS